MRNIIDPYCTVHNSAFMHWTVFKTVNLGQSLPERFSIQFFLCFGTFWAVSQKTGWMDKSALDESCIICRLAFPGNRINHSGTFVFTGSKSKQVKRRMLPEQRFRA